MDLERDTLPPPRPTRPSGNTPVVILGALLAVSLLGNIVLLTRGPRVVERAVAVVPPAPADAGVVALTDASCPACAVCAVCPEILVPDHPVANGQGPRPTRVDRDAAAQAEGHLAQAEAVGERDPVQVAAQRRVADATDRITASHSPAMAERFIQRNLPALASMECAFRDPATAEHVRMRLREVNALARPAARLSEADLTRYERELRCPRE